MRMSLFGEDVCVYDQVFVVDKFYDVLNVTVKEERPGSPYGHGRVMYVNAATVVKPVDVEPDDHLYQGRFKTISAALALESMEQVFGLYTTPCFFATITFSLACVTAGVLIGVVNVLIVYVFGTACNVYRFGLCCS